MDGRHLLIATTLIVASCIDKEPPSTNPWGETGPDPEEVYCGNFVAQEGEECDVTDLRGTTCQDLGFFGGGPMDCSECTFDTSGCSILGDDFETGDLSKLQWGAVGPAWDVTTTDQYTGSWSARGDRPQSTNNGPLYSTLTLSIDIPIAAQVRFWHRESTTTENNSLRLSIDGVEVGSWSGLNPWTEDSFQLDAGEHELMWEFANYIVDEFHEDDWVYIDDVTIAP